MDVLEFECIMVGTSSAYDEDLEYLQNSAVTSASFSCSGQTILALRGSGDRGRRRTG